MSEVKSPKREFFLNQDVSANSLKDIILGIQEVYAFDDAESVKIVNYKCKPIKVTIDSYGGECYSGMALVNMIDSSLTPVYTYCYGKAMSMGLTIFVAGHKRFAHPKATFMQHQLSGGTKGKLMDMIEDADQKIKLQDMLDEVLMNRSNIERETLMGFRERKFDWFFSGQEAFELGVVDELIKSRV